jgi:hypothetical protein
MMDFDRPVAMAEQVRAKMDAHQERLEAKTDACLGKTKAR